MNEGVFVQILLRSNTIFTFNITPAMSGSEIWADGYLIHGTGGVVSSVPLALKHNPVIWYVPGLQTAEQLDHEVARVHQIVRVT